MDSSDVFPIYHHHHYNTGNAKNKNKHVYKLESVPNRKLQGAQHEGYVLNRRRSERKTSSGELAMPLGMLQAEVTETSV